MKKNLRQQGLFAVFRTRETFLIILVILSLAFTFSLPSEKKKDREKNIRNAAVAGGFYPADKDTLEKYVDAVLRQADPPVIKEPIRAIMVPHAGYIYSGPVAAYAYKELEGRDIRTVILIGNSHRHYFDGIAVYANGAFETPLGLVPVNEALTAKLLASDPVFANRPDVHEEDHVLEVQLPFLQRVLKNFKIVPILFSGDSPDLAQKMANVLPQVMDDKTLIVASTDMSHYPSYADASAADKKTLDAILTGKMENFDATMKALDGEHIPQAETFLCSPSGVRMIMLLAQASKDLQPILLKYANSGDSPGGDENRVVGYGAIAFVVKQNTVSTASPASTETKEVPKDEKTLSSQEQTELLKLARTTVESYVKTGKVPEFTPTSISLKKPFGAFVTLNEHGQLRGCIGQFEPSEPLYKVVQQMALSAATQDPRFRPIIAQELDQLEYEISVLGPRKNVINADEIIMGKHGVSVSKGSRHGVFLPQVATETGWGKEEFLSELCSQKAGLPRNCWKDSAVTLQIFTAEVFSEKKEQGSER